VRTARPALQHKRAAACSSKTAFFCAESVYGLCSPTETVFEFTTSSSLLLCLLGDKVSRRGLRQGSRHLVS
jgi:hypothetical protein